MDFEIVHPWEDPAWDAYVGSHPGGTVYHTSAWCAIVKQIGRYEPLCLIARDGDRVRALLPLMLVRSPLTGNRIVGLPFSDVCYPLASAREDAAAIIERATRLVAEHRVSFLELRGAPRIGGEDNMDIEAAGFARQGHFKNYVIPLTTDLEALKKTFARAAVRKTLNKAEREGVTARKADPATSLPEFYRLYALNRRRHGIPPQPIALFRAIFDSMSADPTPELYLVDYAGRSVAGVIVIRYKGVAYAKYEGVDAGYRSVVPIYALLWASIAQAAADGERLYDLGRTAADNVGLNEFKSRWGTRAEDMPYFFYPPTEGLSVVKSDSLKYRLFTGMMKRLPLGLSIKLGSKIFRHFG